MCQATVCLDEEQIMEDVIWVESTEGGVLLRTFFEDPQVVKGMIKSIDLLKHRVLLPHRMEHNEEHATDFSDWAGKASQTGCKDVAQLIRRAAQEMRQVNETPHLALDELGDPVAVEPPSHAH